MSFQNVKLFPEDLLVHSPAYSEINQYNNIY